MSEKELEDILEEEELSDVGDVEEEVEEGEGELPEVFEDEETKPKKEKKVAKPVEILTEDKINTEIGLTYEKYQEMITIYGGWDKMAPSMRTSLNKTFKVPGKFGQGAEKVATTKAEIRANEIKKLVTAAMYDKAEEFGAELKELSTLNPASSPTISIYFAGWKQFWAGLPKDK